jgi:hypothetical protein
VNQLRGASAPRRLCGSAGGGTGSAGGGTGSAGGGGASGSLMQKNRHRDARPIYCTPLFSAVSLMWFKNFVFHRLPAECIMSVADLEGQLAGRPLEPCGSSTNNI